MKLTWSIKSILPAVLLSGCAFVLNAQQLAFPTAEGYGKFTKGGRGGKVYEVTTLKASGSGSLGEAINAKGARTVVFRVAGTIDGSFTIQNGNITIAGQSAPGDGICIKGHLGINTDEVIIRYIRVRYDPTAGKEGDAIGGAGNNLIFDHISCSWSNDEVMSIYTGSNVTIQYCLISEACERQGVHRFGGIWGNKAGTYHHNCFAHNDQRTPRWSGRGGETNDYRNNILYNIGYGGCHGGGGSDKINMIANYYKPGPATQQKSAIAAPAGAQFYVSDNVIVGYDDVTKDNWKGVKGSFKKMDSPWPAMAIKQESAEDAYKTFLKHGGCSFPNRDALDKRIIEEIRTGTAAYGKNGLIDKPADVGGWPKLASAPAPSDGDHDGMPDAWETKNGLNPNNASDGSATGKDGYTNLENYLNGLINFTSTTSTQPGAQSQPGVQYPFALSHYASSHIEFFLPEKSNVILDILDLRGKSVARLVNGIKQAGRHSVDFSVSNLTPGLYIYTLTSSRRSLTGRIHLIP